MSGKISRRAHFVFIIFLAVIITSCPYALSGQFSVGLKGSVFLSFNKFEEIAYDDEYDFLSHKIRFHEEDVSPVPEAFVMYSNRMLYLKAGLAYRKINTRFSYRDFLNYAETSYIKEVKSSQNVLLPLEAGLSFDNFRFGAGPSFAWNFRENPIFPTIKEIEERQAAFSSGFHVTFALQFNKLVVEILYEQRFSNLADYLYYRGDSRTFQQQARYLSLGLGYCINFN